MKRLLWIAALGEHTMNVIPMYSFPSYEDMRLKSQ